MTEQTDEQRVDNLRRDAHELERRADAIPASEAAVRTAEAENLRAAARRARADAEGLEDGDLGPGRGGGRWSWVTESANVAR